MSYRHHLLVKSGPFVLALALFTSIYLSGLGASMICLSMPCVVHAILNSQHATRDDPERLTHIHNCSVDVCLFGDLCS